MSYSLPSDALTFNRYFQITPTGNLKVTQPLPSETSITSLPVCVGFSFVFFFIIRGGVLYISLLVSLDEIGIFYWRAGEGGGGGLLYISILVCK